MTPYEAMHDYPRAAQAWLDCTHALQADSLLSPLFAAIPGRAFDILDVAVLSWPGHGVAETAGFQYNEKEWMLPEEYDQLIDDPTDYLLHVWLPRTVPGMGGFAGLVAPLDMVEIVASPTYLMRWASPEVQTSLEKLAAAGRECNDWGAAFFPLLGQLVAEGFPSPIGAMSLAPFDFIGDTLRGTRGIIVDMFRQPDTLLEACDRLAPLCVKWVTRRANPHSAPLVFMPLHKGADGFMSDEQFKTFYWPTLRKVLLQVIDAGVLPHLFAEGRYGSRLETIMDLPKGKTVWHFDQTDMARAKETIGTVACLEGNIPLSLFHAGTVDEIAAYTRKLIDTAGEGGGYIVNLGAGADKGKIENLRAVIDTVMEYGVY